MTFEIDIKGLFLVWESVYCTHGSEIKNLINLSHHWCARLKARYLDEQNFLLWQSDEHRYINMGCALDFGIVKKVLKDELDRLLDFCQFVVMPLSSSLYVYDLILSICSFFPLYLCF
ncbi:hypothetical protein NPIL_669871 [Nephila pilipes]|uniref:Uncharacterized protein n=1 Tax=Nephila pilipes TaxID=299642 RepID=A0A8X6QXQ7_NEPPI|nr:hypothetical protein NPIL_669871 [Nephila pilipes]